VYQAISLRQIMKKWLLIAALLIAGFQYARQQDLLPSNVVAGSVSSTAAPTATRAPASRHDDILTLAFSERRSNIQVTSEGVVARVLADDRDGSRHQRFLLKLSSGQTLLIAHNIDLAPRIESLRAGDTVAFNGEYEWNERGGVIHWTHHDPAGKHVAGWLRHDGKIYQ
jgi:hypothetical protein